MSPFWQSNRISKTLERGPHRQFILNDGNNKMRRKLYRKIEQKVKYITLVDLVSTETNIIAHKRKKGFKMYTIIHLAMEWFIIRLVISLVRSFFCWLIDSNQISELNLWKIALLNHSWVLSSWSFSIERQEFKIV